MAGKSGHYSYQTDMNPMVLVVRQSIAFQHDASTIGRLILMLVPLAMAFGLGGRRGKIHRKLHLLPQPALLAIRRSRLSGTV